MITKHQLRINDIEEISRKNDVKKIIYGQITKNLLKFFGYFSAHDHKVTKLQLIIEKKLESKAAQKRSSIVR